MSCECADKPQANEPPESLMTMLETDTAVFGWLRMPTGRQLMLGFHIGQDGEPRIIDLKVMNADEAERLLGSVRPDALEDTSWRIQYNVYRPRPEISAEQLARMESLLRGLAEPLN